MEFHWITVVWGDRYTELFVDLVLPTQLSRGNLPALKHRPESVYKIYAPAAAIDQIRRSAAFSVLTALMPVQFVEFCGAEAAVLGKWPYEFMTRCHKHAQIDAVAAGAAAVFLAPDLILCDGSFAALERRALEGHSMLLTLGMHVALEAGRPWIEQHCRERDGSIRLTSQAAVSLVRKHPQSIVERLAVTDPEFLNERPSYIWVPVNERSMVCRGWHLHPILVRSEQSTALVSTIDSGQFFEDATTSKSPYYLFSHSDEFCGIELSPYDKRLDNLEDFQPFSVEKVAEWVRHDTKPATRALACSSIVFDGGDATPEDVAAADRVLSGCIERVHGLVDATAAVPPEAIATLGDIDRTVPTYFYGSGALGRELVAAMGSPESWRFRGFVTSNEAGTCLGFPVLDLKQFAARYRSGDQVIITSMYVTEIAETLAGLNVEHPREATSWYRAHLHAERIGNLSFSPRPLEPHPDRRASQPIDAAPEVGGIHHARAS